MSGTLIHYIKQHNHFLKLSFDYFIFNITCCIDMDSFSDTSKAVIPVTIYIVLCLQNKTFVDRFQKYIGSGICCGKSTIKLAALLRFFFSVTCLTYFTGTMLLSTAIKSVKIILSLFFSIFKYRIFMCLLFLMDLHPTLYKNNSSASGNFLPGHVNRHLKQLIYETNIFKIFSHNFNFNATRNDKTPECISTSYTELITVLFKQKNVFLDNFDYQQLLKTVSLMVCFNSFNFGRLIYGIFIVSMFL